MATEVNVITLQTSLTAAGVVTGLNEGNVSSSVATGNGPLTVGARQTTTTPTWGDGFNGQINQIARYDTDIGNLALSLVMHQMADRAGIALGTPIPAVWQHQPYGQTGGAQTPAPKGLDRRPIAIIKLASGQFQHNRFGQDPDWRNASQSHIEKFLVAKIRSAIYACDRFEIMFSRAGGQYNRDPVMSYVFGSSPQGRQVITSTMWDAMPAVWDTCNLAADNDDQNKNSGHFAQRRGWFYTGGGLPLNDDGSFNTTGHMGNRQVAPAAPDVYRGNILEWWSGDQDSAMGDDRFRCLFLDAASKFYGKFVELVHGPEIYQNFTLIAEAIPQGDPGAFPDQAAARRGAVWFGMAGLPSGPWWNPRDTLPFKTDKSFGYNTQWGTDPEITPIYFGVQRDAGGAVLNLHATAKPQVGAAPVGEGNDLLLGDIYKWAIKGAIPMGWFPDTFQKVGAAWNYAAGRVLPSRQFRSPRLNRRARV